MGVLAQVDSRARLANRTRQGWRTRQPMPSRAPTRGGHAGSVIAVFRRNIRADIADPHASGNFFILAAEVRCPPLVRFADAGYGWLGAVWPRPWFSPDPGLAQTLVWPRPGWPQPGGSPAQCRPWAPHAAATDARRLVPPLAREILPPLWTERALAAKSTRQISESSSFT